MSLLHRARTRWVMCCITSIAMVGALALATSASASNFGNTYLALGDSLAYGYHQAQFGQELAEKGFVEPATFNNGFVDDFGAYMKLTNPKQTTINDGCPGETTETLINGSGIEGDCAGGPTGTPFPYPFLHHPYATGSQLSDALKILATTPNVSPITLVIGSNDVLQFLKSTCGFPAENKCTEAQVSTEFQKIGTNVGSILAQLRAAAPNAKIILIGAYNPFPAVVERGDELQGALNNLLAMVGAKFGAAFANTLPVFNPSGTSGGPESGDIPTICAYTAMCPGGVYNPGSPEADIHPTALGYQKMAEVIEATFPQPHYDRNGVARPAPVGVVSWGTLRLKKVAGGVGEVTCRTANAGKVENPMGGGDGIGSTQTLAAYECESTTCPNQSVVGGYSVPWSGLIQQEGVQPFATSSGVKLIVECRGAGGATETKESFTGSLTPKWKNGMSASNPSMLEYGASSGTLEQEGSGGSVLVQVEGNLKILGFNEQETITIQ